MFSRRPGWAMRMLRREAEEHLTNAFERGEDAGILDEMSQSLAACGLRMLAVKNST